MNALKIKPFITLFPLTAAFLFGCSPRIPKVIGMEESAASKVLLEAGFNPVRKVSDSANAPIGTVASQSPAAGEHGAKSSDVSIYISKGKTLTGEFILEDLVLTYGDEATLPCTGKGGYSDISPGLDIVIKSSSGDILAVGNLGQGSLHGDPRGDGSIRFYPGCAFRFEVDNIPYSDFYEIAIGRRGSQTYSRTELDAQEWNVTYTLGRN